ncbi:tRNA lysidine(34) synthetase TilS [Falsiroseomonas sp. E2-1-a20]|uniref:tRNA lysidine(34) synthetase TilS n=1 Tax=Falsiroseomonas sp. E2-1-a20 TaxID=3239300 RepID=UPI003F3E81ED
MPAAAPSAAEACFQPLISGAPAAAFVEAMSRLGPFGPTPALVAGVSGGPHSLALALLLADWVASCGGRLLAGIVDHGLRPDSGAEAAQVAGWLAARGIPARIMALNLPPGLAVQARAREGRLQALLHLARDHGAGWVALGQHRGDQAETVLLRALAGSGRDGLAGMARGRSAGDALLIRPVLDCSPAALEAVVAAAGLAPVRDPSNSNPRFTRARLRVALADPDGEGPATEALAAAAAAFARRRLHLRRAVAARIAEAAWVSEAGFARLDLPRFGQDVVARAALAALVRAIGGATYAPAPAGVAGLLGRGAGSLGGAILGRDGLLMREEAALAPACRARDGVTWDGRFRLSGQPPPGLLVGALGSAAAGLPRPGWLPAAVAPTLPAFFAADDGALVAVPSLSYPSAESCPGVRLRFAPRGGAVG